VLACATNPDDALGHEVAIFTGEANILGTGETAGRQMVIRLKSKIADLCLIAHKATGFHQQMLLQVFRFSDAVFFVELVHVAGVIPDDHAVHHHCALSRDPKREWPTKKLKTEVSRKENQYERDKKPNAQ
jgi:hypothetical protein